MSHLPTPIWNPSAVLNIITVSDDISCAGVTQKGLSCGYGLGGEPKSQARQLLNRMSQKSPRQALDDLPQLARHCLCQKNHQAQATTVVAKWTAMVEPFLIRHEKASNSQNHQPAGHIGNTSIIFSNDRDRPRRSSAPKPDINEIIAELDALTIRQDELRSMLRDAQGDGSARTTPSRSTPRTTPSQSSAHLVNQPQFSELEDFGAGESERRGSSSSRDAWKRVFGRGKY